MWVFAEAFFADAPSFGGIASKFVGFVAACAGLEPEEESADVADACPGELVERFAEECFPDRRISVCVGVEKSAGVGGLGHCREFEAAEFGDAVLPDLCQVGFEVLECWWFRHEFRG